MEDDVIFQTLSKVLEALSWMDVWGQDSVMMSQAKTLHYDMAGKAKELIPSVHDALDARRDELCP